ncbi:hypothetical protein HC928_12835 [bacterium]|nr:hypothetical protein [bacterium]
MPEGYLPYTALKRRLALTREAADSLLTGTAIQRAGNLLLDSSRISREQVREVNKWSHPTLPGISSDGRPLGLPIDERAQARDEQLQHMGDPDAVRIMASLAETPGYALPTDICTGPEDDLVLESLVDMGFVKYEGDFVYDPLRLSQNTMQEVCRRHELMPLYRELIDYLAAQPGHTAPLTELEDKFTRKLLNDIMNLGGFTGYSVPTRTPPFKATWVRLKDVDEKQARSAAADAVQLKDEDWAEALSLAGDVLRPGARDGKTRRIQVVARTYTINKAAKRLGLQQQTIEDALLDDAVVWFDDPEGKTRIPAYAIEGALNDIDQLEHIASYETVKARELAIVAGVSYSTIRRRLSRQRIKSGTPQWGIVRGQWNLPDTLHEFRTILDAKIDEERRQRAEAIAEQQRLLESETRGRAPAA